MGTLQVLSATRWAASPNSVAITASATQESETPGTSPSAGSTEEHGAPRASLVMAAPAAVDATHAS